MNIAELLKSLEVGLSIVGFIAISAWLMKWAKGLHERTKELSEIDKEIRSALRDSFVTQKELHEIRQKKLEGELTRLSEEMATKLAALNAENDLLRAAIMAVDVSSSLALNMRESVTKSESENMFIQYKQLAHVLEMNGIVSKDEFPKLWGNFPETLKSGSSTSEEIAWRLTKMMSSGSKVSTLMDAFSVMTPKALNYVLENPRSTQEDVKNFIANDLRESAQKIREGKDR